MSDPIRWDGANRPRQGRCSVIAPDAVQEMVGRLAQLHEKARGCEFDLVPADGPIAQLTLFMHEHGGTIAALLTDLMAERDALAGEVARLREERDTPETANFLKGVQLEAAHQRDRWGSDHDAGKTPFDWFWLIGYLAQKAAQSAVVGDLEKAKHHTISTSAALANWHNSLAGESDTMRPGILPPETASAALAGGDNADR